MSWEFAVPAAADITLTLDNAEYAAALNNKSSDMFRQLADQVEQEVRDQSTYYFFFWLLHENING